MSLVLCTWVHCSALERTKVSLIRSRDVTELAIQPADGDGNPRHGDDPATVLRRQHSRLSGKALEDGQQSRDRYVPSQILSILY